MKNIQNLYLIFGMVALFALSSCFVGRNYERPSVITEGLYRTDNITDNALHLQDTNLMSRVSWKEMFSDNLLVGYIQTALDNNLDVQIALKSIDAAEAYLKQSEAAFTPAASAELDAGYVSSSKNGAQKGAVYQPLQLSANFAWEADVWGKLKSQERANTAAYLQTVEAHRAVKTRLIASVASTYFQLLAISSQMQITRDNIASRDSIIATTKALKAAGRLTEVAVYQAEAQLYDAQMILLNLQKQDRIAENAFCLLLNQPFHTIQRNTLEQQQILTPLAVGVPTQLLANRPDVKQAEYGLMQAFELTNVSESYFYPSLTLTASTGLQSTSISDFFNINSLFGNIAGGLLQPIFNRRQIETANEIAKIQQDKALLNYQSALLSAGNEVSNALYDYQMQTQAIIVGEKQYNAYSTAANYSKQLLENGLATYLEVLTARQSALNAQLNLAAIRYAKLNAITTLYRALGGGVN